MKALYSNKLKEVNMKQIIKQIQNFYDSLDKMIIFGVLVILFALTFIFNFMWAMPKTFMFLVGLLVGKILFGTNFVSSALHGEEDTDLDYDIENSATTGYRSSSSYGNVGPEYNDFGQPNHRQRTSLEN